MNQVILTGRLGTDPELIFTPTGKAKCSFSLAVNATTGKGEARKQHTTWVDITCWRGLAETVAKYLAKGRRVNVVGRLAKDSWKGKDDSNRSRMYVVAGQVEFLDAPNGAQNGAAAEEAEESDEGDEGDEEIVE